MQIPCGKYIPPRTNYVNANFHYNVCNLTDFSGSANIQRKEMQYFRYYDSCCNVGPKRLSGHAGPPAGEPSPLPEAELKYRSVEHRLSMTRHVVQQALTRETSPETENSHPEMVSPSALCQPEQPLHSALSQPEQPLHSRPLPSAMSQPEQPLHSASASALCLCLCPLLSGTQALGLSGRTSLCLCPLPQPLPSASASALCSRAPRLSGSRAGSRT